MNIFLFILFLCMCIGLIVLTFISLLKLGDERKVMIQNKAQVVTFTGVIGFMSLQFLKNLIRQQYEGVNPLTFLIVFSLMYLSSLVYFKKKYGG